MRRSGAARRKLYNEDAEGGQAKCTVLWDYITDWQSGRRCYLIPGRGMGKLATPIKN